MNNPLIRKTDIESATCSRTFKCILYARKSTEEIDTRSIENQKMTLMDEFNRISENDPVNKYVLIDFLYDEDCTGTNSNRPDFQNVLRMLSFGEANMLMVCDLSRLSRNVEESLHYVQNQFVHLQVRFISLMLPCIDSYVHPNSIYNFDVPMHSVMNENHCKETSDKVKLKFNTLKNNKCFIGAFAPYGWIKDPKDKHKLVLDEYVYDIMHKMKDWLFEGCNAQAVSQKLNARGILTPGAYEKAKGSKHSFGKYNDPSPLWNSDKVRAILTRPANIGTLVQGREKKISYKTKTKVKTTPSEWSVHEDTIPAIFTREEQEEILKRLETRTTYKKAKNQIYLFSGFLKCADCGRSVTHKTSYSKAKNSKRYTYEVYSCNYHKQNKLLCSPHRIKAAELEEAVLAIIRQQIDLAVSTEDVIKKSKQQIKQNINTDVHKETLKILQCEKDKFSNYKKGLYEDYKDGIIDKDQYLEYKQDYSIKENKINEKIKALESQKVSLEKCSPETNEFFNHFLKYRNIKKLTREILGELVDHILVHEDKRITVKFKYQDSYTNLLKLLKENEII